MGDQFHWQDMYFFLSWSMGALVSLSLSLCPAQVCGPWTGGSPVFRQRHEYKVNAVPGSSATYH